ncbi:MAG: hypothetical protein H7233_06705 [Pseudorhodobacter sp.]|nr:hypothetical protein [Frankiaceae bacterium]
MNITRSTQALSDTTPGTSPANPSTPQTTNPTTSPAAQTAAGTAGSTTTQQTGGDMPTVRQRAARLDRQPVRSRTADPAGASLRVDRFIPGDPAADEHLPLIRTLASAAGPVNAQDAAELLTVLAGLACHLAAAGVEVTAASLLDPARIDRWVLTGLADRSSGTAANYRLRALRVAAAVNGTPRKAAPLHGSDPTRPYSPQDEDAIVRWAAAVPGGAGLDLLTAVALSFGAGLTVTQIRCVRVLDVAPVSAGGDLTIEVTGEDGLPGHVAPVRRRYAKVLRDACMRPSSDGWLFRPDAPGRGGRNGISNLVDRHLDPTVERFSPQRARATWIVRHLEAGTRVDLLLAAAGVTSLSAFAGYVQHMTTPPPSASSVVGAALFLGDNR